MFERQLDWIGRHFQFVTLDEIGTRMEEGRPFDRPVAAVTFDDGYRDVYEQACPILLSKGIPATFFIVTDLVEHPGWQIFDRLYRLLKKAFPVWIEAPQRARELLAGFDRVDVVAVLASASGPEAAAGQILARHAQQDVLQLVNGLEAAVGTLSDRVPPLVTWEDVRDLRRRGFTIGSHTRTHTWLPRECPERVTNELAASRVDIERRLEEPIAHFAYPAGEFNREVVGAVAKAGYRFAYTICAHRDADYPFLTIPRELLWEHSATDGRGRLSPAQMSCHVRGVFSGMNGCAQQH